MRTVLSGRRTWRRVLLGRCFATRVAVGILAFGTMAHFAGQALMRRGSWRLLVGVMGTSAGQLIINRLADQGTTALAASLLVGLPLTAYLVATIGQLPSPYLFGSQHYNETGVNEKLPVSPVTVPASNVLPAVHT